MPCSLSGWCVTHGQTCIMWGNVSADQINDDRSIHFRNWIDSPEWLQFDLRMLPKLGTADLNIETHARDVIHPKLTNWWANGDSNVGVAAYRRVPQIQTALTFIEVNHTFLFTSELGKRLRSVFFRCCCWFEYTKSIWRYLRITNDMIRHNTVCKPLGRHSSLLLLLLPEYL